MFVLPVQTFSASSTLYGGWPFSIVRAQPMGIIKCDYNTGQQVLFSIFFFLLLGISMALTMKKILGDH